MVEFRPLIISFILIGLFAIAMINVVYFIQVDNDADETILSSQYGLDIYKENLTSSINYAYDESQNAENSTSRSQVSASYGSPFLESINGIWKTIKVYPVTIYQLTIGFASRELFNGPEGYVITTTLAIILSITIIFAVWKMISTGDGG